MSYKLSTKQYEKIESEYQSLQDALESLNEMASDHGDLLDQLRASAEAYNLEIRSVRPAVERYSKIIDDVATLVEMDMENKPAHWHDTEEGESASELLTALNDIESNLSDWDLDEAETNFDEFELDEEIEIDGIDPADIPGHPSTT